MNKDESLHKNALTWTFVILVISFATLILSPPIYAGPFGFNPGSYLAYVEGGYLQTTKNYDDGGNTLNLSNGNQFTEYSANVEVSYDFSRRFGIYSNLLTEGTDATTYPLERTNTGLSEFGGGMSALLWSGFVNIIPDVSFIVPLYPTPGTGNTVLLGDGAFVGTGKLYLSKNFKKFSAGIYGGYSYRSQNLSALIPWGALANISFGDFFLDLRGEGETSVGNDVYPSSSQARRLITDNLDGGSYLYDTIDPSLITATARLGWHMASSLFITAGVEQTLTGQRSAQYTRFVVGLGITDLLHHASHNEEVQGFEVDTQSEDTNLNTGDQDEEENHATNAKTPIYVR